MQQSKAPSLGWARAACSDRQHPAKGVASIHRSPPGCRQPPETSPQPTHGCQGRFVASSSQCASVRCKVASVVKSHKMIQDSFLQLGLIEYSLGTG